MEKERKKRKGVAEKEREKKRKELHGMAAKCMNIQEVFAKVNSSAGSQTKSVNLSMHKLDKDQSANCNVHTGLISDSHHSSRSKTVVPPSIPETTAPPSLSKTIAPPSSQHQSVNTSDVVETTDHMIRDRTEAVKFFRDQDRDRDRKISRPRSRPDYFNLIFFKGDLNLGMSRDSK